MRKRVASLFLFSCWFGLSAAMIRDAGASWLADGVALSPNSSNYKPSIISDQNGSIIAWYGGASSDIFARRVLPDGTTAPGWPRRTRR